MQKITLLKDKRIILAVTGSIAVYKAVDLASKLTQAGALVDVIMTQSAQKFVTPLTFQAVTGRPVYTDMWKTQQSELPTHIAHVGLGEGADLMVIAPCTAQTLAKLANGFADNLLSVTYLAARCPLLIAPAMDGAMYEHPAVQQNLLILRERGATVIEPEVGRFASGLVGKGRLPETPTLIGEVRRCLAQSGALSGHKVVVTAGGTREAIDPVRYVTNRSSGKQGFAIAQAYLDAGADVTLITTMTQLPFPVGANIVNAESASELLNAVLEHSQDASILVMAAAVADYRPAQIADQKIKKSDDMSLSLVRTADILLEVKQQREQSGVPNVVIGFAAESENLLQNAQSKLERKGLDLLIGNDISKSDRGFAVDTNQVIVLDKQGGQEEIPLTSKAEIAEVIVQRSIEILNTR